MAPTRRTFVVKKEEADRRWHVVDVSGKTLGRAATAIAHLLRGKHKPTFTPHVDNGDFVVVINAQKVKLSGKKLTDKLYYDHTLFPGGLKIKSAEQMLSKHPEALIKRAVKGMLPKGPLGRKLYTKLKVYAAAEHPHEAQQPQVFQLP
ncbi:MAG TPA: 50S ribosomal protein L13 [Polyangia bacterium]|jgi:large subunit ribosomal protein L13